MSNAERTSNLPEIVKGCEPTFTQLAKMHKVPSFTFARESAFALQLLKDNDYLARVALGNPDSLKQAIVNVAAIGLSLSPVFKFAYLVPRKGKVCLDISYQGFVELATSRGVVSWCKAVLVFEHDKFEYLGVNKEPVHACDPFATAEERGKIDGGFVLAKLASGDVMVDFMAIHEIEAIRNRSESWKSHVSEGKSTPWKTDEHEMIKKTLIRRAYKSWPKSGADHALAEAVTALDNASDIELHGKTEQALLSDAEAKRKTEGLEILREFLNALERTEEAFIEHLTRANNRTIKALEDLTPLEINQAMTFLEDLVEKQAKKLKKLQDGGKKDEIAG